LYRGKPVQVGFQLRNGEERREMMGKQLQVGFQYRNGEGMKGSNSNL
jgi:hypothetical protein